MQQTTGPKSQNPAVIGLYWDQLWRQLQQSEQPALWDVPPSQAIVRDHALFGPAFSKQSLPVIDMGCGSGLQTGFLGDLYAKVVGIDASKKAVAAARAINPASHIDFRRVNMLSDEEVADLHQDIGDANIYLRGVIHQIPYEQRPLFIGNIKRLLGSSGTIYLIETADNIQAYINELANRFSELPLPLKRVMASHYPPLGVSLTDMQGWFGVEGYTLHTKGHSGLATNIVLENGDTVELPAVYALVTAHPNGSAH